MPEDSRRFDVSVDDAFAVNLSQRGEYISEVRSYPLRCEPGLAFLLQLFLKTQGHVREHKHQALLVVSKGLQQWDAGPGQLRKDTGLADRIVWRNVVRLDNDLEGPGVAPIYFGRDAAGDVLAVLVRADPDPRFRHL
ncbi:hypothetical protein PoMZ_04168 [Pyricularia oryzae]|uniref:Uncharacterized protein n=1 Tax=Pyricularia oryzae TaxID=318829 RepID=A0A4P7N903_PYROR|nr:hypothetical protein PoMZ_04168 [Pyricularia oryzae]